MFKKIIIPLLLLTSVVMMTIYYIKNPLNKETNTETVSYTYETKNPDFSNKRINLTQKRTELIDNLENEIASGTLTSAEIESKINEINELNQKSNNEVMLEDSIILLGYEDCFVEIADSKIIVFLIAKDFGLNEFISVATLVKTNLESQDNLVSVEVISPNE